MNSIEDLIAAARKEIEVDVLLEGAEIVNTLSGDLSREDVAILGERIVGFDCSGSRHTIDLSGCVLSPGFIDGHVHIESAMVTIPEYARIVIPKGTTSIVIDPHEITNVWGEAGMRYMLDSSRNVPLNVYIMIPSCVPASKMETSGAILDAEVISTFMDDERVLGLGEVMNYPGVLFRDPEILEKIRLAGMKRIDGHAPQLTGEDLTAYIIAGIGSDHECISIEEAREKLRKGMYIMIREGSAAKNLRDLLPLITHLNSRRFMFVSDDRNPTDILVEGHINFMVKTAIETGLEPILALQISSLNPAEYFGIPDLGAIAPGYRADIAVLDDLEQLHVVKVVKDGKLVAEDGRLISRLESTQTTGSELMQSIQIGNIGVESLEIEAKPGSLSRVIGIIPDQIITRSLALRPKTIEGKVVSDTDQDILKMAVVERHKATGNVGLGLVQGFGLQSGAIASSIAHDSHNIVAVGVKDEEMLAAILALKKMGGGLVVMNGKVKASLSLPVAGLFSEEHMTLVSEGIRECVDAAREGGSCLKDPFMTLSFLCLPVIPELKLTDLGLVDVSNSRLVPLFLDMV